MTVLYMDWPGYGSEYIKKTFEKMGFKVVVFDFPQNSNGINLGTELAEKSMVSVGTIARFENGSDIGLLNLIKLLKALDLEEKLDLLIPDPQERPSNYVDNNAPKQRARKRKKTDNEWKWGDEE